MRSRAADFLLGTIALTMATFVHASGTAVLTGHVEDNQQPVAGARVDLRELRRSVVTKSDGSFAFDGVEAGRYTLVISMGNHASVIRSVILGAGQTIEQDVQVGDAYSTTTLEALNVTAQAMPAETTRAVQQFAPNIVNVLSAEEIRKLPDVNAGEAVRRVPGISLETDTGEGRFVNIRGLDADLNGATFGGVRLPPTNVASPLSGGRAVAFDSIPAGLIGAITVTKTNTPDRDAEALGGSIEITPKQVPPHADRFLEAEIGGGVDNIHGSPVKDFSLSGGGRFGFGDSDYKPFSFIGTIAYFENKRGVDDIEAAYADDQANGTPDKVFNDFEQRFYNYHRRRKGFGGELSFQPDTDNRWYVRYFDAGYTESVNRQRLTYNMFQGGTGSVNADPNNPSGFIDPNITFDKTLRDEKETLDTRVATIGGENHFRRFKIDYRAALAIGSYNKLFDYNSDFSSPNPVTVAYDNTSDPRYPRFSILNGPNPLDPANYTFVDFQNSTEHDHDQEYSGAFNLTVPTSYFKGGDENMKFGISARLRNRHGYITHINYNVPALPLDQVRTNELVTFYNDHYQNGYNISADALRNFFAANPGAFVEADPLADQEAAARGYSKAQEDVYAIYGQYLFKPIDKLGILSGARIERTEAKYGANQILLDANGKFVGVLPNERKRSYNDVFPTIQARYEWKDNLIARASYSKTIARPGFNQVTAAVLIDPSADSVTRGNPDLKPTTSDNFDASLEYYLDNAGIVSIGVFDKELSDYIINKEEAGTFPNNGLFAGFTGAAKVFTFDNIKSAYARGLELNYVQKFSSLPGWLSGFGISTNYTLVDSRAEIRLGDFEQLPSTSKNTANFALFYDKFGLSVDLGAYYVSKNIFSVGASPATDIWSQPRLSVDLGTSYALNSQISLFFNVKNLTDTRLKFTEGSSNNRPIQREFYGQTIITGFRLKL